MRIKLAIKSRGYNKRGFQRRYLMVLSIYDVHGDFVAREERLIDQSEIEDGEHFNFPALLLAGIDDNNHPLAADSLDVNPPVSMDGIV